MAVETSCTSEGGLGFVFSLLTKTKVLDYRDSCAASERKEKEI